PPRAVNCTLSLHDALPISVFLLRVDRRRHRRYRVRRRIPQREPQNGERVPLDSRRERPRIDQEIVSVLRHDKPLSILVVVDLPRVDEQLVVVELITFLRKPGPYDALLLLVPTLAVDLPDNLGLPFEPRVGQGIGLRHPHVLRHPLPGIPEGTSTSGEQEMNWSHSNSLCQFIYRTC